jgi:hypothetical protein
MSYLRGGALLLHGKTPGGLVLWTHTTHRRTSSTEALWQGRGRTHAGRTRRTYIDAHIYSLSSVTEREILEWGATFFRLETSAPEKEIFPCARAKALPRPEALKDRAEFLLLL